MSDRSDKHGFMFDLGSEKLDAITLLLVQGKSGDTIVEVIQKEWGVWLDEKPATIKKRVQRYYNDIVRPHLLHTVASGELHSDDDEEVTVLQQYKPPTMRLDSYKAMEDLALIQCARLAKLYEREKNMGTNMDAVRRDVRELYTILSKLGEMQMDLGLMRRLPKALELLMPGEGVETRQYEQFLRGERGELVSNAVVQGLKQLMREVSEMPVVVGVRKEEAIDAEFTDDSASISP